jgi:hypothetical protein
VYSTKDVGKLHSPLLIRKLSDGFGIKYKITTIYVQLKKDKAVLVKQALVVFSTNSRTKTSYKMMMVSLMIL